MTIPNLVVNYQKKQTVVRLRKVYSDLNNAVQLSEIDNGPMSTWAFPDAYLNENLEQFLKTYYLPYFKSAKLYSPDDINDNYIPKQLNGLNDQAMPRAYIQLNNGVLLGFFSNPHTGYIWLKADINGKSGPNIIGKDIFIFDVYKWNNNGKYKIRFWNYLSDTKLADRNFLRYSEGSYSCNPQNTTGHYVGYYCGALIEYDNWTIADDYPW